MKTFLPEPAKQTGMTRDLSSVLFTEKTTAHTTNHFLQFTIHNSRVANKHLKCQS